MVRWPAELQPATFVRRDNRFRATVALGGVPAALHVPNSGRLGELLVPGAAVWYVPATGETARKTTGDLVLVERDGTRVAVDARLPNHLVAEALAEERLAPLAGYTSYRREVASGHSRLDLLLEGPPGRCWLEVKSVTLVEEEVARFPDAPTVRGVRHLEELAARRAAGDRAVVVFVVQRGDAVAFGPHASADPAFGEALRRVHAAGVEVLVWRCGVSLLGSSITDRIEAKL
jgi:sugar fermentation stimulation protein A